MAYPDLIIVGLFFFIVPGLVLAFSPTAFVYGLLLFGLLRLIEPFTGKWLSALATAGVLITVSLGIPFVWNQRGAVAEAELRSADVPLPASLPPGRIIALIYSPAAAQLNPLIGPQLARPQYPNREHRRETTQGALRTTTGQRSNSAPAAADPNKTTDVPHELTCGPLCNYLLTSQKYDAVIVGRASDDPASPIDGVRTLAWRLGETANCAQSTRHGGSSGLCLTSFDANLSKADVVIIDRATRGFTSAKQRDSVLPTYLQAHRLEMRARINTGLQTVGRITATIREPMYSVLTPGFVPNSMFSYSHGPKLIAITYFVAENAFNSYQTYDGYFAYGTSLRFRASR